MGDLTVSVAGPERIDDLEVVYRVLYDHHHAVSTWHPGPERGADVAWRRRRAKWEQALSTPAGIAIVAERDGKVVGGLVGGVGDAGPVGGSDLYVTASRVGDIHDFAVLPGERGAGVGSAIFALLEDQLRCRGATAYGLQVLAGNDEALRFYEAQGLVRVQTELEKPLPAVQGQSVR